MDIRLGRGKEKLDGWWVTGLASTAGYWSVPVLPAETGCGPAERPSVRPDGRAGEAGSLAPGGWHL